MLPRQEKVIMHAGSQYSRSVSTKTSVMLVPSHCSPNSRHQADGGVQSKEHVRPTNMCAKNMCAPIQRGQRAVHVVHFKGCCVTGREGNVCCMWRPAMATRKWSRPCCSSRPTLTAEMRFVLFCAPTAHPLHSSAVGKMP